MVNNTTKLDSATLKRAVIYLRVSTTEQAHAAGASEGYSIPALREACSRKAENLSAELVAEFTDRGESARSAARPELRRVLIRAFIDHIKVDADQEQAKLASPWLELKRTAEDSKIRSIQISSVDKLSHRRAKTTNPGARSWAQGSIMNSLVDPRGLEPLTSSTSMRRSSQLS